MRLWRLALIAMAVVSGAAAIWMLHIGRPLLAVVCAINMISFVGNWALVLADSLKDAKDTKK